MVFEVEVVIAFLIQVLTIVATVVVLASIFAVFFYMVFQFFKHRKREQYALDFVTLMVRLPKDNEIKIDAAEQMFAGSTPSSTVVGFTGSNPKTCLLLRS